MKSENWLILFLALVAAFFVPYYYYINLTQTSQQENVIATNNVISACQSAMDSVLTDDELLFSREESRRVAIDTFYGMLGECYNYTVGWEIEARKYLVPCLMLVDTDGYYLTYSKEFTASDGSTQYAEVITDIHTWIEEYGNYQVRYYLNNYIEVISRNGTSKVNGNYADVYNTLGNPSELSFLGNPDMYKEQKNAVIIGQISDNLNYYINTHNLFYNKFNAQYSISLPQINDDGSEELLETPNIIAFMQSKQKQVKGNYANVYCLAASDICEKKCYVVEQDENDGHLYYHEIDCLDVTHVYYTGTMEQCANRGANPSDCVR